MGDDFKVLGGLKYYPSQVEKAEKLSGKKYRLTFKTGDVITYPEQKDFVLTGKATVKEYMDGEYAIKKYTLDTKSGSTVRFDIGWVHDAKSAHKAEQDEIYVKSLGKGDTVPRNASITQTREKFGLIYDDNRFDISNVMGATFTSTKKNVSKVCLDNSTDCTINLGANDSKFYGDEVYYMDGKKNNKSILDKNDKEYQIPRGAYFPGISYYINR